MFRSDDVVCRVNAIDVKEDIGSFWTGSKMSTEDWWDRDPRPTKSSRESIIESTCANMSLLWRLHSTICGDRNRERWTEHWDVYKFSLIGNFANAPHAHVDGKKLLYLKREGLLKNRRTRTISGIMAIRLVFVSLKSSKTRGCSKEGIKDTCRQTCEMY